LPSGYYSHLFTPSKKLPPRINLLLSLGHCVPGGDSLVEPARKFAGGPKGAHFVGAGPLHHCTGSKRIGVLGSGWQDETPDQPLDAVRELRQVDGVGDERLARTEGIHLGIQRDPVVEDGPFPGAAVEQFQGRPVLFQKQHQSLSFCRLGVAHIARPFFKLLHRHGGVAAPFHVLRHVELVGAGLDGDDFPDNDVIGLQDHGFEGQVHLFGPRRGRKEKQQPE
jgi:hypothetical protein